MVPCSGIFPWVYLTSLHMLWQCLASDLNHSKVVWTKWRGYMCIWIKWGMRAFGYRHRSLINQRYQIRNLITNNLYMGRSMSYVLVIQQNLCEIILGENIMLMLTYSMTNSLTVMLQRYFIWSIKPQWIGILRNTVLRIQTHMVLNLFLTIHVWSTLLIWGILFDTLVYSSAIKATCLEIKNLLLTVPSTRMPSFICSTLLYNFIESGRLLNIIWLPFDMYF